MNVALEIPFDLGRRRRAAGAVIGRDLALSLRLDQRKAIAADAGRLRLDHRKQRGGSNRGVGRSAAFAQHVDCSERGKRVRGRHHRVRGVDRGAAGEMEIPHAKKLTSSLAEPAPGGRGLHDILMRDSAMGWYTSRPHVLPAKVEWL